MNECLFVVVSLRFFFTLYCLLFMNNPMTVPKVKRKKVASILYIRFIIYASVFLVCLFTALYLHEIDTEHTTADNKNALKGQNNGHIEEEVLPKSITLHTSQGDIRVTLRPDLSLPSVRYIKRLLDDQSPCKNCRFYRAEKPGILQGILRKENVEINKVLGDCPDGMKDLKHKCPDHDPNCGCHGPVMKRGMIAW